MGKADGYVTVQYGTKADETLIMANHVMHHLYSTVPYDILLYFDASYCVLRNHHRLQIAI